MEKRNPIYIELEKADRQLLPPRYDFYERKSKNRYTLSWKRPTGSCCSRATIFTSGKAKTGIPALLHGTSVQASCWSHITNFASEKAKTAKHVLNIKVPAAAAHALQFLWAEKQKPIYIELEKAHRQLLLPRYDFYKWKSENWYTYSSPRYVCLQASCWSHITNFVSEKAKMAKHVLNRKVPVGIQGHDVAEAPTGVARALLYIVRGSPSFLLHPSGAIWPQPGMQ